MERDWHFHDPSAGPGNEPQEFLVEGVARCGWWAKTVEAGQADRPVAAGGIADGHAKEAAGEQAYESARDVTKKRPALGAASRHAARAHDDIGRWATNGIEGGEESGNVGRIVAGVGVDIDRHGKAPTASNPEPFLDRRAEAAATLPHEHVQAGFVLGCRQCCLGRAVGRVIIHDQQLHRGISRQHALHQRGNIGPLGVGGRHHEHPAGGPFAGRADVGAWIGSSHGQLPLIGLAGQL